MNSAQCLGCLSVLVSRHRHDFVTCACGALSIDGGLDYQRIVWDQEVPFKILEEGEHPFTFESQQESGTEWTAAPPADPGD